MTTVPAGLDRRTITGELFVVFAVSLGADAVTAMVSFVGDLTARTALSKQRTTLVSSLAPGRPWLDLALQLVAVAATLAPVALVIHLLRRSGETERAIGLDLTEPGRDTTRAALLALVIGGAGLGLYLVARHLGVNLTVVPTSLPAVWWRVPVLVLVAAQNGLLEEVLVVGYLLHRLAQLRWSPNRALLFSAAFRGSYHLYQGLGGFVGNFTMGLIFGRLYQRWGRVTPLVFAHALIDIGAFVGYTLLRGKVSWLP